MSTNDNSTLTSIELYGIICVEDTDGGVWWPSDEAIDEINAADDPGARAIEICVAEPMRGTWHA